MKRLVFLPIALPLTLSLGACSFGGLEKTYISRAETIPVTAPATVGAIPAQTIAVEDAAAAEARNLASLLLPEGAGKVLRVREKQYSNGTRQEIIIATDKGTYGENVIDVHIRTAEASAKHTTPLTIGPPSENGIRNEILSRFPDVPMNIVTRPIRNALGPFGLAIGKHPGGARCVFAWQWIEDLREATPGTSGIAKMNALVAGKTLAASVRIRLCRSDSTVDQLASQLEGLQIGSRTALDRIATLDRRSLEGDVVAVSGARSGQLVKPVGGSLEAAITRPVKRENAPVQVARAKPKPQARRYVRREQPQQQAAPVQAAPVYVPPQPQQAAPAANYGQRYMAPVAGMAAPPAYGAAGPSPVGQRSGAVALPPQAYRGPGYPAQ